MEQDAKHATCSPVVCSCYLRPAEDRDLDFRVELANLLLTDPEVEQWQRVHACGFMVGARRVGVCVRASLPVMFAGVYRLASGICEVLLNQDDFDGDRSLRHTSARSSLVLDGILDSANRMVVAATQRYGVNVR